MTTLLAGGGDACAAYFCPYGVPAAGRASANAEHSPVEPLVELAA